MQQLQPDTTLQGGKYKIVRGVGQGGFGNTYVGYNTGFDEIVAIKEFFLKGVTERDKTTSVVKVSNADNVQQFEEQLEKFKKEARRIRKLKNEHIVKVHDLFEENDTAYYVMDYIEGESLAEKMAQKDEPLTDDEVRPILIQILSALKEVHQKQIWHLDLKPGNIMVDKNGKAFLIDFGASKQMRANGKMTTTTALCYTPGYAPSEQIGQMYDRFGPWTDIYALGATVYKLLTNKQPPMTIDIEEDGVNAFAFPESVSQELRKLVIWMMQPKRKDRPQSVDEILSQMQSCLKGQPHSQKQLDENAVIELNQSPSYDEKTTLAGSPVQQIGYFKAVDLGLSVLWAEFNVGGNSKAPIGGLYGWADSTGEQTSLKTKDYIDKDGYTSHDISGTKFDIATVRWGQDWRMPSKRHWMELIERCRWTKVKAFNIWGYRVEGPNGNSIFLPNTGIRFGETISNTDAGYYWTSEMAQDDRGCAYYFYFDEEKQNDSVNTRNYVYSGRAVRPICDKNIPAIS